MDALKLSRPGGSEESDSDDERTPNLKFKNDGSFLETFKKMQNQSITKEEIKSSADGQQATSTTSSESQSAKAENSEAPKVEEKAKKPSLLSCVGKRRGGKILPTGVVKKVKKPSEDEEDTSVKKDPWSQYLSEVRKYKERSCQEEDKNRPLVK